MTEAEWRSSTPNQMIEGLSKLFKQIEQQRKGRLFQSAIVRHLDEGIRTKLLLNAVEAVEEHVDRELLDAKLEKHRKRIQRRKADPTSAERASSYFASGLLGTGKWSWASVRYMASQFVVRSIDNDLELDRIGKSHEAIAEQRNNYRDQLKRLLICIFGNPFRPVAFDSAWLSSTARGIAEAIYDDRAFDRLPILGDALQDAGCENDDILSHCRGEGPHVRGCWVVDGVLGKV